MKSTLILMDLVARAVRPTAVCPKLTPRSWQDWEASKYTEIEKRFYVSYFYYYKTANEHHAS
jgi:hypothetical protein